MIEIRISSELAGEHSRFVAACAERGHRVEVFDSGEAHDAARGAQAEASGEAVVPGACALAPSGRR
jgi:hypothetical protein